MKFRNNVLIRYTLVTFFSISIFTIILAFMVTNWSEKLQIDKHIELYPQIINQKLIDSPQLANYIIDKDYINHQTDMKDLAHGLLKMGSIVRVKIWDINDTILWSDESSLIGKITPVSELYSVAITGKNAYLVSKPSDKAESATEAKFKNVLEIYVPIKYNNKVVGVFEIYEDTDNLFIDIRNNTLTIWFMSGASGIVLYMLLFGIFYNSYQKQKDMNNNLLKVQEVTIQALAAIAETKDKNTGDHLLRTQRYVGILANHLKNNPKYKKYLTSEKVVDIVKFSPLHDIGKVGIADSILNKPGKLTPQEFEIMKLHPKIGYDSLSSSVEKLGLNSFLETAMELIYTHHEKWDGSGYPQGLKGENIPLSGRIMALADVYDALVNKRVYKEAYSHEKAKKIITDASGTHFDKDVVDAFLANEELFKYDR